MPRYDFRCHRCGDATERHSLSAVPDHSRCPHCGDVTRRIFSSTYLSSAGSPAARLLDYTVSTASDPPVVSSLPPARRSRSQPTTTDPRHIRLPRP